MYFHFLGTVVYIFFHNTSWGFLILLSIKPCSASSHGADRHVLILFFYVQFLLLLLHLKFISFWKGSMVSEVLFGFLHQLLWQWFIYFIFYFCGILVIQLGKKRHLKPWYSSMMFLWNALQEPVISIILAFSYISSKWFLGCNILWFIFSHNVFLVWSLSRFLSSSATFSRLKQNQFLSNMTLV